MNPLSHMNVFGKLFTKPTSKGMTTEKVDKTAQLQNECDELNEKYKNHLNKLCYDKHKKILFSPKKFEIRNNEVWLMFLTKENIELEQISFAKATDIVYLYGSLDKYFNHHRTCWLKIKNQIEAFGFVIVRS